ncbi:unnamed protein product [Notodromas monacha]|uniref:NADH dehydrogenase [ubiquinone] 1 beta subcomplex subunit 4 n=1 Tax=Notodromas monacha TaxID=399045 RepID=A0A7R9GCN3_9CRUS|nr:unnamed protein product [Notodromas monacha]CAG0916153.1 unnamed protein product [Notodromas monacha]
MATQDRVAKTWGITEKDRDLIERRAATRMRLRKEYQRQLYSPYNHGIGEGGYVFDPMIQRFLSMKATLYDHFKPTPRTAFIGLATVIVPIFGSVYFYRNRRLAKAKELSEGRVAYADRLWKLI